MADIIALSAAESGYRQTHGTWLYYYLTKVISVSRHVNCRRRRDSADYMITNLELLNKAQIPLGP